MPRFGPALSQHLRRFLTGHVPFLLALAGVTGAIAMDLVGGWSFVISIAIGVILAPLNGWKRAVVVAWFAMAAAISMGWRVGNAERDQAALLDSGSQTVVARLQEDATGSVRSWTARAKLLEGGRPGAVVLWRGASEAPAAGTRISAMGDFSLPEPPRNPGEFDRRKWMASQGIVAVFSPAGLVQTEVSAPARWSAALRHGFADAVVHGLDEDSQEAQVIRAMVIGKRPHDADAVILDFRNSGALHVFCVSGLHVTMVGAIAWLVLGRVGLRRRQVVVFLIPIMFGYAWITGYEAPAARAAWMATAFLGAFVLRRKPDLLNALGIVLLVHVLWDGRMIYQPGVQLSYGVVAVIALAVAPASRLFQWIAKTDEYLPLSERGRIRVGFDKARAWVAGSLAVSCAAGIGSAPLTAFHFGILTPISLVANLLLLPLVGLILSFAMSSAILFPLAPSASTMINRLNACIANSSVSIAGALAEVPGGHFLTRRPEAAGLIVHDLPYGAMSSVFTDRSGRAVLHDCGGKSSFRWSVLPSLRYQGIQPTTVIFSHPDGSHMGGGFPVWQMLPIDRAVLPVKNARSRAFEAWDQAAPEEGVRVTGAREGVRVSGPDGSKWHCLYAPPHEFAGGLADDRVAVWRLDWKGWKFLFMADAGYRTERELLESGTDLSADVIIAGKHREDLSLNEEFLAVVKPRVIIGKNPRYPPEERHPQIIMNAWRSLGIQFIDQETTGALTVKIGERGELVMIPYLAPERRMVLDRERIVRSAE